ncbi:MAG: CopG family transcriptional regulator [Polyangiaceae bacterium]
MIRTQISFDAKLYARAKTLARKQGISLAELCRQSLASAIAAETSDKPWMKYAGTIDGHPDDSGSVDDVVYGRDAP